MAKFMEISKKIDVKILLFVVLAFLIGWQLGQREVQIKWANYKPQLLIENKLPPKSVDIDFKLFWDTWDLLSRQYLDKESLDPQKLLFGAISGMVSALGDPYTYFLNPEQQKSSREELNGAFEGVGIQLGFNKEKKLVVEAPLSGTPAERSGIKALDMIVKIDDKDTTGLTLPEAVKLIRGPKGTKVSLTIYREGDSDTKSFELIRDTIIVKSVEVSYKETKSGKSVGVIKLSRFGERTKDEWNAVLEDIQSKDPQALILDVRNNPGGFLEGAVFIASEFLDGGVVVLQENAQGRKISFSVDRIGKWTKKPMIVLINKGSASASEIVAGALQDRKRARLVGEKSFGKGTIQEAQDLPGGTGIHITVAKWLTPKERWVNDTEGLEPDIVVKMDEERKSEDVQLEKALEMLE